MTPVNKLSIETFEDAQKAFLKAQKNFETAQTKLSIVRTVRDNLCPHTEQAQQSRYYDGGYDYTAHTDHRIVCECCGKLLKEWSVDHGYYG